MSGGLFYLSFWAGLCPTEGVAGLILLLSVIIKIPTPNADSVYLDQTPRFVASDLSLQCLPMSLLWDARHK